MIDSRDSVYRAANLAQCEIDLIESYIECDNDGCFIETETYEKLFHHFCDTGEIPYAVATQSLTGPNTDAPDDWIIEHLTHLKGETQ